MFYFKHKDDFFFMKGNHLYCIYSYNENFKFIRKKFTMYKRKKTKNFKIKKKKINYFVLNRLSEIKKIDFTKKRKIILELFDIIIYIDMNETFCYDCFKVSYLETLPPSIRCLVDEDTYFYYKPLLNNKILLHKGEYIIYDKNINKIENVNTKSILKCDRHIKKLNTENIILKNKKYSICETGYRRELSKKIDISFGRLRPIINIENKSYLDKIGFPIYVSQTASNKLDYIYSFHGGKGFSNKQSFYSAFGEGYERFSSRIIGGEDICISNYLSLSKFKKVLNPFEVINEKYNKLLYSNDKEYEWCKVKEITKNETVYVPANIVFFPYNNTCLGMHMISQTTTGLATGTCIEEAILQALFEIIERDSYVVSYLKNKSIHGLKIELDPELKKIETDLLYKNIKLHLKYLENEYGVHVVHCTTESCNFPIYSHGSGAALDIKTATKRAIIESIQLRTSQIDLKSNKYNYENVENIAYRKWGEGNREWVVPFLNDDTTKYININEISNNNTFDLKKDIEYILEKFKKKNKKIYVANLSREYYDLNVVRVIIPEMQDIDEFQDRKTKKIEHLKERVIFS